MSLEHWEYRRLENDDFYEENQCPDCVKHMNTIDEAKHFLEGVMEHLYGSGELNTLRLETNLEDLCYYLGVKVPENRINVARPRKIDYINAWDKRYTDSLKQVAQ